MKIFPIFYKIILFVIFFLIFMIVVINNLAMSSDENDLLGPQSKRALGEQRLLIVAVRFQDVKPTISLQEIKRRTVTDLGNYIKDQSYGLTWIEPDFKGWVLLPDLIETYKVSPNNFQVEREKVRKLIEDTMTAIENNTDFSRYQNILIIPGASTIPGKGYGMMCYCANPGMLTGVRGTPRFVTLTSKKGQEFSGGVFVGTENAPLGMLAHDYFHTLGGVYQNKRLVPCLYNFERQAEASRKNEWEYCTNYMGPWDVMSAHYVKPYSPPSGISSFTRIRLGWISAEQVKLVKPGETAYVSLSPLEEKGETLVIKIPLEEGQYYLVENRQPIKYDEILPDSGILILKINPEAEEGSGTAMVMDANPGVWNFSEATFTLDRDNKDLFFDKDNDIAIIPLWTEEEKLGVLVTNNEKSSTALKVALEIEGILKHSQDLKNVKEGSLVKECIESFKDLDFISCQESLRKM
ncbi:hypothetical protein MUP95_07935 [bacterium]|nr:hypothetical protein [bacterium]